MTKTKNAFLPALLAVATLSLASNLPATAQTALSTTTAVSTPTVSAMSKISPALKVSTDLGQTNGSQALTLTVRMKASAALHQAIADRYDKSSPNFHKWMTDAELKQYAPTDAQVKTVQTQLESHGLKVESVAANNLSLRVTGTAAQAEAAFNTPLHQFSKGGTQFRANVTAAQLTGVAQQYVSSVGGLESHTVTPMIKHALNMKTMKALTPVPLKKVLATGGLAALQTEYALTTPSLFRFDTPGANLPLGYFYGNVYNADTTKVISFTAPQLEAAYGLPAVYKAGFDGTGQTIVLLEAYGYSNMQADGNAFSSLNGIAPLDDAHFSVVYPTGQPADQDTKAALTGWDGEIALDIDWAHAIAPGAKIVVVATGGQDNEDFQYGMQYIVDNGIGYTVSDSWETDTDIIAGPLEQQSFEDVLEVAAAKGVSFQFSTGDGGDGGVGTPVGAAGVPSDAPHATAVGGTALLNNINGDNSFLPVGWGDTLTFIASFGVLDPVEAFGQYGGAGGGESTYFAKPSWQANLPGTGRQTPDVSALADPFTGVPTVLTENGVQYVSSGIGGTSLASPIFTAFWALAQQSAGGPLGQASPLLASLPPGGLTDVLPLTSPTNPIGLLFNPDSSHTFLNTADVIGDQQGAATGFASAVWDLSSPGDPFAYSIAFGLNGSLTTTLGWDNTTGYGTPYGMKFIQAVTKAAGK